MSKPQVDPAVLNKLKQLISTINRLKTHLATQYPGIVHEQYIVPAIDQLTAIVHTTEESVMKIIQSAEQIEQIYDQIPTGAADYLQDVVTRIYESSNFQDLNGQRIAKVIHIIEQIAPLLAGKEPTNTAPTSTTNSALKGPQLPGNEPSQSDIDALFK
jgi:chemotaxis protein CheZ